MTIFILVLITLSLMGSALWILPTKSERQKMSLRMAARKHGLTVQITQVELPDRWDKSPVQTQSTAYHLYRNTEMKSLIETIRILPYEVWKYIQLTEGWWCTKDILLSEASKNFIKEHQSSIVAIDIKPNLLSFYWNEKGDEKTVDGIHQVLKELSAIES